MNKEIIINGVDISGCYFLNKGITNLLCTCPSEIDEDCKYNSNCYFKQLQRKTTECEKLKTKLDEYEKAGGILDEGEAWYSLAQKYNQALDEIKGICKCNFHTPTLEEKELADDILDIIREAKENN